MATTVLMNIKHDSVRFGESRSQPFMIWLQFVNFVLIYILCWTLLKVHRWTSSLFEWMFPFRSSNFCNPLILVLGSKNELNDEIVKQLSQHFNSRIIELHDDNGNMVEPDDAGDGSRIVYTKINGDNQESITRMASSIRRKYGNIDLLVISEKDEPFGNGERCHAFLKNLNKQLLIQFWIVMAFLPGMLKRNKGHIVSVALGKTSSLTNTGIVRSVCEELISSETDVKLKLVERNPLIEDYLPELPKDLLAGLIIKSIRRSHPFVKVPSTLEYLIMLPLLVIRFITGIVFRILNISSRNGYKSD